MKIDSLPSQYTPFKEIDIGTNRLIDVQVFFAINGHVPLLIGSGEIPRIWLSIPADPKGGTWQLLVRDNKSLHPNVEVRTEKNLVVIDTPDGVVLQVRKEDERMAKVLSINLRPFGLNIHGNETMLTVMNNNLAGNTFTNVKVMVGIGADNKVPNKGVEPTS